jgi:cytochrome c556
MKTLFLWFLSMLLSFGAGTKVGREYEPDTELEQKVQAHMDVIVDEAAGIVDDVTEAAKEKREAAESEWKASDEYKQAEQFVNDVEEIVDNTAADIDAHFGTDETEAETEPETEAETVPEAAEETELAG